MKTAEEVISEYPIYKEMTLVQQITVLQAMKEYGVIIAQNLKQSDVNGQLPFSFVEWYSGMEFEKILVAYKRYEKEKENGNLR